jgi:hypothetical protein
LRTTDQIDNSVTTKFVYIGWVGPKVGYMQKSRVSVHGGPIKQFIGVRTVLPCFVFAVPARRRAFRQRIPLFSDCPLLFMLYSQQLFWFAAISRRFER